MQEMYQNQLHKKKQIDLGEKKKYLKNGIMIL